MKIELKPCPFCGGGAEIVVNTVGQFCAQCIDSKCGAVIIAETYDTVKSRWNRRKISEPNIVNHNTEKE